MSEYLRRRIELWRLSGGAAEMSGQPGASLACEVGLIDESPLVQLRERIRSGASPLAWDDIAQELHAPSASLRGAASFYDDLHTEPDALRVCRGTSCALAGGEAVERVAQAHGNCRGVYCLGYCDRSPAILTADGRACAGLRPEDVANAVRGAPPATPSLSSIRCTARHPVVTGRLKDGGCAELAAARAAGAYAALERALRHSPAWTIQQVEQSGVRGRGGAGFPTGLKWRLAAGATGARRYVIANGDEGDPGSYIDRLLMEFDPHAILEGLLLGGFAIGAQVGVVYIRSEYPAAHRAMLRAVKEARDAGFLGPSVCGSRFSFDVHVFPGMGSYVCGEETALINAIEGQRGEVRVRPPYPVVEGLFGCPTVVDNVETLVNMPWIVVNGPTAYQALGTTASPGTKALCFNHGFAHPGIVEVSLGTPLRKVIDEARGDREIEAILLGGPMGSIVPAADWDAPICITEMDRRGITLGHGGMVALTRKTDYRALLAHLLEFMKDESCGKCVPCRIGSRRAWELAQAGVSPKNSDTLLRLLEIMGEASLCAFGRETPQPVRRILQLFPDRIFGTEGGRP